MTPTPTPLEQLAIKCETATTASREKWRQIPSFENLYEVSDIGRVRRHDGYIMTPSIPGNRREYPCVHLRRGRERKRISVHRLVAMAFLDPPKVGQVQVRHLDGNHLNPRADNLAWGTSVENARDRDRHGMTACGERHGNFGMDVCGTANPNAVLTDEQVRSIRRMATTKTQRKIADEFCIHQAVVWRIIHRKAWAHVE